MSLNELFFYEYNCLLMKIININIGRYIKIELLNS